MSAAGLVSRPAAVASQVIQRDRHAELLSALAITGASLEKFALEIRGLQKTEIGELEEPFAKGQKGSSAMPHKRNPIGCEQIVGLARLLRGNCQAAFENIALWHERDISHSSVERVILPDSFIALDHMLRRFTRIVKGMVVYPERMRENLERSRGVVFSGTVLLELAKKDVSREQAYEWVQRNAMRSFAEQSRLQEPAAGRRRHHRVLRPAEIERAFDLDEQFRHVDHIFDRVFGPTRARESTPERGSSMGSGRPELRRRARRRAGAGPGAPWKRCRQAMRARVFVTLKPSVFDPQGRTIADALHSLGYAGVADVRQGKYFELDLATTEAAQARGTGGRGRRQAARRIR